MAFHPIDRDNDYLLPPSVQEWLPEPHLARYVVDVVEGLDLSELERAYAGRGREAYHPATLLSLLIYGYATGTFSSPKIERATFDSLAFRYIACNRHPDHDTLATFRNRFGKEFQSAFVQVLQVARENQLSRFGTVSLDGTKIHANASRHRALSYGHASMIEAHLKAEVEELLALAEAADQSSVPDGVSLPDEIKRREDRLAAIATAKAKIEARAKERYDQEHAEYEAKMAARAEKEAATGKKSGGRMSSNRFAWFARPAPTAECGSGGAVHAAVGASRFSTAPASTTPAGIAGSWPTPASAKASMIGPRVERTESGAALAGMSAS